MCDMDADDPPPNPDADVATILRRIVPEWDARPASCGHRCTCECHRVPGVAHAMPCCTGCGHGHKWIAPLYLHAHLKTCHGIGDGQ